MVSAWSDEKVAGFDVAVKVALSVECFDAVDHVDGKCECCNETVVMSGD